MSNVVFIDDFKEKTYELGISFETELYSGIAANMNDAQVIPKKQELSSLVSDLHPVVNKYFDQLHNIRDIDELIESLQRAFVFLNKEIDRT